MYGCNNDAYVTGTQVIKDCIAPIATYVLCILVWGRGVEAVLKMSQAASARQQLRRSRVGTQLAADVLSTSQQALGAVCLVACRAAVAVA